MFDQAWTKGLSLPLSQNSANVEWGVTSCEHNEGLAVTMATGSSEWWLGLQVVNANYPVFDVHTRTKNNDGWQKMKAEAYNQFTRANQGSSSGNTVDLKISCSNGRSVEMKNVRIEENKTIYARDNC